jgi:hypothetical protein
MATKIEAADPGSAGMFYSYTSEEATVTIDDVDLELKMMVAVSRAASCEFHLTDIWRP